MSDLDALCREIELELMIEYGAKLAHGYFPPEEALRYDAQRNSQEVNSCQDLTHSVRKSYTP